MKLIICILIVFLYMSVVSGGPNPFNPVTQPPGPPTFPPKPCHWLDWYCFLRGV